MQCTCLPTLVIILLSFLSVLPIKGILHGITLTSHSSTGM